MPHGPKTQKCKERDFARRAARLQQRNARVPLLLQPEMLLPRDLAGWLRSASFGKVDPLCSPREMYRNTAYTYRIAHCFLRVGLGYVSSADCWVDQFGWKYEIYPKPIVPGKFQFETKSNQVGRVKSETEPCFYDKTSQFAAARILWWAPHRTWLPRRRWWRSGARGGSAGGYKDLR